MRNWSLADLKGAASGNVADSQGRSGHMNPEVRPVYRGARVLGQAYTVLSAPGDNLACHRALELAPPGCVLVVATGGFLRAGFFGGIMAAACRTRGIAGLVTDGACRDSAELEALGFPVFASGLSPGGTTKTDFGFLDIPVTCGGIIVRPGDLVYADDDGVVVIARERADEVLSRTLAVVAKEQTLRGLLAEGRSTMDILGFPRPDRSAEGSAGGEHGGC